MTSPIRVLLVDDQALLRAGIRMVLEIEDDIEVVGEAGDGVDAIAAAQALHPDVVVMDIRMPRMDGIEATRRILSAPGAVPRVLVVTTFDLDEYVYEALRAGASGFVLKDLPPEHLVDAIRTVARGEALLSPKVTKTLIGAFVGSSRGRAAARPPKELGELTARELEILQLLARGMSNAEIAAAAYVSEATAKTHVARILTKLGLRDRVQVVVYAYEHGVVEPGS